MRCLCNIYQPSNGAIFGADSRCQKVVTNYGTSEKCESASGVSGWKRRFLRAKSPISSRDAVSGRSSMMEN